MGLSLGCLGVLTIWQLASSRGMNPTERKRDEGEEGGREESLKTDGAVFYSLISEVTCHLFCNTGYKQRPCHNVREEATSMWMPVCRDHWGHPGSWLPQGSRDRSQTFTTLLIPFHFWTLYFLLKTLEFKSMGKGEEWPQGQPAASVTVCDSLWYSHVSQTEA